MTPADPQPPDRPDDALDERLGELINDFFDRRARGEAVTEEQFLADHPEHADVLRQHMGGLHLIESLGSSVNDDTLARPAEGPFRGSSAQPATGDSQQQVPQISGYDVQKPIGRGGMGLVYRAIHLSTKRVVALKVLLEGPFATDAARKRFEREVTLAAGLKHPNIIPIYDSGSCDGRMYYAMEFIYGLPLNEYFRVHGLGIPDMLGLLLKVFAAVSYAHQRGVIHRDLKPSNILVDGNGEPHILDFGLAKSGQLGDVTTSISAAIIGTPAYMSPEQASADPNSVDIRADVYSLGVVLYEALCKAMPYDTGGAIGKTLQNIAHAEPAFPTRHNSRIDADLAAIALKALEKNKDNRYQSVDSFSQDIRRFLAGEPISARQATGLYLLKKAALKHRRLLGTVAAVLFVSVASLWAVRQFTKVSTEKQGVLQELAQAREDVARKDAAIEELVRKGTSGAAPDVLTDAVLSTLKPEQAAVFRAISQPKTTEERTLALVNLLASQLAELSPETANTDWKTPDVDQADQPLSSPRPDRSGKQASPPPAPTKTTASSEEMQRIFRALQESAILAAKARQSANNPANPDGAGSSESNASSATSQATTTQPAGASSATSKPADSTEAAPPASSQPADTAASSDRPSDPSAPPKGS